MDLLNKRSGLALAGVLLLVGLLAYVVWQFMFAGQAAPPASWTALNEPMEQLLENGGSPAEGEQGRPGEADGAKLEAAGPAGSGSSAVAGDEGTRDGRQGELKDRTSVGATPGGYAAVDGDRQAAGSGIFGGKTGAGAGTAAGEGRAAGAGAGGGGGQEGKAGSAADGGNAAKGSGGAAGTGKSGQGQEAGRLELNLATLEQLDTLPGIGVSKAQAIVAYRAEAGPFKSVDELTHVKGIGEKLLAKLRPYVYVMPR